VNSPQWRKAQNTVLIAALNVASLIEDKSTCRDQDSVLCLPPLRRVHRKTPHINEAVSSMKLACRDIVLLLDAANPTHARPLSPCRNPTLSGKGFWSLLAQPLMLPPAPSMLQHLYSIDPQPPHAPLFSGLNGCRISHGTFIACLNLSLSAAGLSGQYTGHSFRHGAASSAAVAGYLDYEIQLLGCWCSDVYRLYIDVPHDRLLHLSAWLHWAIPDTQPFAPPELHFAPTPA